MTVKLFRGCLLYTLLILCITTQSVSPVQALSAEQKALFRLGINNYDVDPATCTSTAVGGNVTVTGENVEDAYNFFLTQGFSPEQSAGIVGNLQAESNVIPTALNSIGAYGIAQWLGGRLPAMRTWVAAQNPPNNKPDELGGQLLFIIQELNTTETKARDELKKTSTPTDAATSWSTYYERNGNDGSLSTRISNAVAVAQQYASSNGQGVASNNGNGTCSSAKGSSPDCIAASGNTKILCEAKQYEGIYYTWGGGHQGYDAFVAGCPDPSNPPNNQPHGGNDSHNGNPSPCGTDCSGLVSIAIGHAFGVKKIWTVSSLKADTANWRKIEFGQAVAGDVVTRSDEHIEIVDHIEGSTAFTFGSHETGKATGPSSWDGYDSAYRYVGQGAS